MPTYTRNTRYTRNTQHHKERAVLREKQPRNAQIGDRRNGSKRSDDGKKSNDRAAKAKKATKKRKISPQKHISLTKENLERHTRQTTMSISGESAYGNGTYPTAQSSSDLSPPPALSRSPPRKKRLRRQAKRNPAGSYTTQLTPRKLKRIREFEEIDKWQLSEELVLY